MDVGVMVQSTIPLKDRNVYEAAEENPLGDARWKLNAGKHGHYWGSDCRKSGAWEAWETSYSLCPKCRGTGHTTCESPGTWMKPRLVPWGQGLCESPGPGAVPSPTVQ